ncbi:type IV secretory pathway TraG/TraD family ATPase VirD4 [Nocardia goodfellowii]|uniref:Type IV secretory pathway TraG/TraD family ATPase VirD4 n=1 Tax=Nocardia goodfellowii TaxID=882446 RepID=A0ABS4QS72_9NOCA|nr:type IV secretory pathway TraG/TraD family ATPase VirD4 [Nocardia goodfellowii]
MKQPNQQSDLSEWKELIGASAAIGLAESVGMSMRVGERLYSSAPDPDVPWNPISLVIGLGSGDLAWTAASSWGAATLLAGTAGAAAGSVWAWRAGCRACQRVSGKLASRKQVRAEAVDAQAQYMAHGHELADLSRDAVLGKARELKVVLRTEDAPGVLVARAVQDGREIYASYEDLHLDIWGPRSGKSTSRVIPAVMEAPGAVVATSNKRDVVDATRTSRSRIGEVHVFDPQQVAEEPCGWYWDPIAWVAGSDGGAGAQERAAELAGYFAASEDGEAKGDNFFPQEGEDLLAGLFLAAAVAKRPITDVYEWVTTPSDREPIDILSGGEFDLIAAGLSDQYNAADKQRSGVFSTAKKQASCLRYVRIRPWVTPPAKGEAPRKSFDVDEFIRSRGTLYPLSEEGKGSAGPLVTALCAAVADAGKREGRRHPGGRLPVPPLFVLDEAANIVRWPDLPKQYSHFGSRGIVVLTILQSWAQGVRCWGESGMRALLSATNVLTLGAGLKDTSFLKDMSELVGSHYELSTSTSVSRGATGGGTSRSTSTSRTTEITLAPSDLAALPKGRVLVFVSGHRATLAQAVPWFERPYAAEIAAALDELTHSAPAGRPRLRVVPTWGTDAEGQTA